MHKHTLAFGALMLLFSLQQAAAQTPDDLRARARASQKPSATTPALHDRLANTPLASAPALEQPVDPATYIVGPGDKFLLYITLMEETGVPVTVTAEGKLIVPTLGVFDVAGQSLAAVRRDVTAAARSKYTQGTVSMFIVDLRIFRVHILGEVNNPGIYAFRQTDRLSDALLAADDVSGWADPEAIELRRKGEERQYISFSDYQISGELGSNPTLLDGDVVFVPRISSESTLIRVEGRISNPGLYVAKPNESIEMFLRRVTGATRKHDILSAVVRRPLPPGSENQYAILPLKNLQYTNGNGGTNGSIHLQSGDIVSIPSIVDSVYVQGAVRFPGAYPFYPGFRARDYAGVAGPDLNSAGLNGVRVRHPATGEIFEGPDAPVRAGDTVEIKVARRVVMKDYLQLAATVVSSILTFIAIREAVSKN